MEKLMCESQILNVGHHDQLIRELWNICLNWAGDGEDRKRGSSVWKQS